jgi:hypothetical protein
MIHIRSRGVVMRSLGPFRVLLATATVPLVVLLGATAAVAAGPNTGFGFDAGDVAGFPTGAVDVTGGGAFNSSTGFVQAGGGFTCASQVSQGPLAGCAGEGVRWDTADLLSSTTFKCTGSASEASSQRVQTTTPLCSRPTSIGLATGSTSLSPPT